MLLKAYNYVSVIIFKIAIYLVLIIMQIRDIFRHEINYFSVVKKICMQMYISL